MHCSLASLEDFHIDQVVQIPKPHCIFLQTTIVLPISKEGGMEGTYLVMTWLPKCHSLIRVGNSLVQGQACRGIKVRKPPVLDKVQC